MGKSLTETAKMILSEGGIPSVGPMDAGHPDRDAKNITPNKATLRPGSKSLEGRFTNPGATSEGELSGAEDLGGATPTSTYKDNLGAKASGKVGKDSSRSSQSRAPVKSAAYGEGSSPSSKLDEDIEISEELEAFIEEMMEEGYSEDEIAEAIEENFEIVEAKDEDEEDEEEEDDDEDEDEKKHLKEGPFQGVGKMMMKYKLKRGIKQSGDEMDKEMSMRGSEDKWAKSYDKRERNKKALSRLTKEESDEKMMKEHVDALLDGENLSEDFRVKAETIFESAVSIRVNEELQVLEEAYAASLNEEVENIRAELTEQLDDYLNYVVEQWVDENEVAIEAGLRTELTEDFITGLKSLFAEHYMDIPDEKVSVVEQLASKVEALESKLNEEIDRNVNLTKQLNESKQYEIFVDTCEGLTDTQASKLRALAENVNFTSADEYAQKLNTLREAYFSNSVSNEYVLDNENSVPGMIAEETTGRMSAYVKVLGKSLPK